MAVTYVGQSKCALLKQRNSAIQRRRLSNTNNLPSDLEWETNKLCILHILNLTHFINRSGINNLCLLARVTRDRKEGKRVSGRG